MRIIGCDLHTRQQTVAMVDTTTGEVVEKTLMHEASYVREFYSTLAGPVCVGIEATGSMQWFVNLTEELGIECRVGHPTKIRAAEPRKQKHDRRDADLILKLLRENRFPSIWLPSKALLAEGNYYSTYIYSTVYCQLLDLVGRINSHRILPAELKREAVGDGRPDGGESGGARRLESSRHGYFISAPTADCNDRFGSQSLQEGGSRVTRDRAILLRRHNLGDRFSVRRYDNIAMLLAGSVGSFENLRFASAAETGFSIAAPIRTVSQGRANRTY